ncbi:WXG100 family type VII secretion target [Actinomadura sp. 6N118]|uniref:WXG100 family type VII secretion target n=1 Tax=Actinomadura sp. 6N118 TaxID=3375151 RepID=UPI003791EB92
MAADTKIVDSEKLGQAATTIDQHIDVLGGIRASVMQALEDLGASFESGAANKHLNAMLAWDAKYNKIIQALINVKIVMGSNKDASDQRELDNSTHAETATAAAESVTLPV